MKIRGWANWEKEEEHWGKKMKAYRSIKQSLPTARDQGRGT